MPHSPISQKLTKAYRQRLDGYRARVQREALRSWPSLDDLPSAEWPERMAAVVSQAQTEAIRSTAGYLSAFLTAELGRRISAVRIDSGAYVGIASDGQPLAQGFQSPIIGLRSKLKEGASLEQAMAFGRERATRQAGMDLEAAHRSALLATISADDRFDGWQRVTKGTCGACLALAAELQHSLYFPAHPGCTCVSQPVVAGLSDHYPVPNGSALFAAKSEEEQDEALGPKAAALVRAGVIELSQLVEHEELDSDQPGFITQKPVDQLIAT